MPQPAPPIAEFDIIPPKLSKIRQIVKKARSSSAPGPNGIPYNLYKYYPKVLWYLLRTAWKKQLIPSEWQRAVAVFIPKEVNFKIQKFKNVALLNEEGKLFFSVLASSRVRNDYIDSHSGTEGRGSRLPKVCGALYHDLEPDSEG